MHLGNSAKGQHWSAIFSGALSAPLPSVVTPPTGLRPNADHQHMDEEGADHRAYQQADCNEGRLRYEKHQTTGYFDDASEVAEPQPKPDFLEYAEPQPPLSENLSMP